MDITYDKTRALAIKFDREDPLNSFRQRFHIPKDNQGKELLYFCGNSLGLMPNTARKYTDEMFEDWAKFGVEGHTHARHPWLPYHEFLTQSMAQIVGALPSEVVVMNSLTVNLHLLLASFYRPTQNRHKILVEYSPFPSDRFVVRSQIRFHGFDPDSSLLELQPDQGETISTESILEVLEKRGDEIALILIGGVNYYTGQAFDMKTITEAGHAQGCMVGFDLAHAAGNLRLELHDSGMDFAAWCGYKYLNSGPGGLSGVFIHQRHHNLQDIPRLEGWWGQDKESRFLMGPVFNPIPTAEAWQLSNPPILPMATLRASLDIFDEVGMIALRKKSEKLTHYLEFLLSEFKGDTLDIITPEDPAQRGCQLSIQIKDKDKSLYEFLTHNGVIADWREPDVIRVAPVPLYNTFTEVWDFVQLIRHALLSRL